MKIGILSDTHNHVRESRRALDLLLHQGASLFVHCGDAGEDVIDLLSAVFLEHGIRTYVAIGNCESLPDAAFAPAPAGVERCLSPEFTLDGKRCIALHGHHAVRLHQVLASERFDYVFTGHTHLRRDERHGRTRLLNPGSPARPRGGPPTVLLLDLATDTASWLPL